MALSDTRSPAHRAALGFLRGGLIAVVSIVLPGSFGAIAVAFPMLDSLVTLVRILIPVCGFAVGGAVGGDALGFGKRGSAAFGFGGFSAGLVLQVAAPNLRGLTGFESPSIVVAYGVLSSMLAFGLAGVVGGLGVRRGRVTSVTAGFVAGGAIGGFLGVAPFLLERLHAGWPPDLWMFVFVACSVGSVVLPLVVGGSTAARVWSANEEETESFSE